jgi:hypothetical protein
VKRARTPSGSWKNREARDRAFERAVGELAVVEDKRRRLAARLFEGFYRCPTTGRILEALKGDDKVVCHCGRSNPVCPSEGTERTGTHLVRYLQSASVEDWLDQGKSVPLRVQEEG